MAFICGHCYTTLADAEVLPDRSPMCSPAFTLRVAPDGSKVLTLELCSGIYYEQLALSNVCGSWAPWDIRLATLGAKFGHPTRRQAVELVGEDPVRWLEKGAED